MKFEELKNKSERELRELLNEKRHELRSLRFKASENQLKNIKKINDARRTVAKLLTLLKKNGL